MIGKKGYKKSGHLAKLIGTIEKDTWEQSPTEYLIRFSNGAAVGVDKEDIVLFVPKKAGGVKDEEAD